MWFGLALVAWYCWCLFMVAWIAIRATSHEADAQCMLLLGRRSPPGHPHPHFQARIDRAGLVLKSSPSLPWVLSGGAPIGQPSEASIARAGLDFPVTAQVEMEEASLSTWHNFRNTHQILSRHGLDHGAVAIISNRYHLARCAAMAKHFNLSPVLCAAEEKWEPSLDAFLMLAREAGYLMAWHVGKSAMVLSVGHRPAGAR